MKVIVCGAGQVGFGIARQLASEQNDVTVIDQSPQLVHQISDTLDVRAIARPAALLPCLLRCPACRAAYLRYAAVSIKSLPRWGSVGAGYARCCYRG